MFCPKCGSQNPDGALFCTGCGEKLIVEAAAAVSEAAAPVAEEAVQAVEEAAAPVVEAFALAAEEIPAQQPEFQQPVYQQPVYQQPAQQPVYQQPVYQQPVYQQPVYQQPVYQQPAAKKKSKAPLIILLILVVLLLAAGGLIAYETFFASEEDRPEWLAALDFKKEGSSLAISAKEQKTFKNLVKTLDEAIIDKDAKTYSDTIPSYARDFVWSVYGEDNAKDFVNYLFNDEESGVKKCGDDIEVTEEIVSAKKLDAEDMADAFKEVFNKKIAFEKIYLVSNNSCFKGDEDSEKYYDYYLFFIEDDEDAEYQIILIGEDNLKKFGLK